MRLAGRRLRNLNRVAVWCLMFDVVSLNQIPPTLLWEYFNQLLCVSSSWDLPYKYGTFLFLKISSTKRSILPPGYSFEVLKYDRRRTHALVWCGGGGRFNRTVEQSFEKKKWNPCMLVKKNMKNPRTQKKKYPVGVRMKIKIKSVTAGFLWRKWVSCTALANLMMAVVPCFACSSLLKTTSKIHARFVTTWSNCTG